MTTDLDSRIRRAVIEVVDTAPPPPAFVELSVPVPRNRPVRRIVTIAVVAVTVVALAIGAAMLIRDDRSVLPAPSASQNDKIVQLELDRVSEGVSARSLRGVPVYLVRRGGDVETYSASFEYLGDPRQVWWCRDEKLFAVPSRRLLFDRRGRTVEGSSKGLDRFETNIHGDRVDVDLRAVQVDHVRSDRRPPRPFDNWYLGSPAFCRKPLVSGGYTDPTRPADANVAIRALPTLKYGASEITVPAGVVQILFTSAGGAHTLVFDEPKLGGFQLSDPGGPALGDVELDAGVYTFYCSIPGHRAAGEEGTLVVTPK